MALLVHIAFSINSFIFPRIYFFGFIKLCFFHFKMLWKIASKFAFMWKNTFLYLKSYSTLESALKGEEADHNPGKIIQMSYQLFKIWRKRILKQRKAVKKYSPVNSQSSQKVIKMDISSKKILKSLHPSKFAFMGITKGRTKYFLISRKISYSFMKYHSNFLRFSFFPSNIHLVHPFARNRRNGQKRK